MGEREREKRRKIERVGECVRERKKRRKLERGRGREWEKVREGGGKGIKRA